MRYRSGPSLVLSGEFISRHERIPRQSSRTSSCRTSPPRGAFQLCLAPAPCLPSQATDTLIILRGTDQRPKEIAFGWPMAKVKTALMMSIASVKSAASRLALVNTASVSFAPLKETECRLVPEKSAMLSVAPEKSAKEASAAWNCASASIVFRKDELRTSAPWKRAWSMLAPSKTQPTRCAYLSEASMKAMPSKRVASKKEFCTRMSSIATFRSDVPRKEAKGMLQSVMEAPSRSA
mmetsp:Transcript_13168/g.30341  ORF Transcript_13168/g.30341 Transcript_13168/m.30341 type:complete len:236 (+) Transcript_13168:290-997(+)